MAFSDPPDSTAKADTVLQVVALNTLNEQSTLSAKNNTYALAAA
jgi:hypothetical protein